MLVATIDVMHLYHPSPMFSMLAVVSVDAKAVPFTKSNTGLLVAPKATLGNIICRNLGEVVAFAKTETVYVVPEIKEIDCPILCVFVTVVSSIIASAVKVPFGAVIVLAVTLLRVAVHVVPNSSLLNTKLVTAVLSNPSLPTNVPLLARVKVTS